MQKQMPVIIWWIQRI